MKDAFIALRFDDGDDVPSLYINSNEWLTGNVRNWSPETRGLFLTDLMELLDKHFGGKRDE